jgi:ribosome-associated protein
MRLNKLTKVAVSALEDIKARDILVLDVRKLTAMYDTLIIATADSARQTKALALNVRDDVKKAGGHIVGMEGEGSGEWVLLDCAEFVVHIMQPAARAYYNLEELWTPPEPARTESAASTEAAAKKAPAKKAAVKKAGTGKAAPPASTKPATKKPAVKKVVAKKAAVKSPATKKPAAKGPAAKKPVVRRRLKTPAA